jgi:exosome complex RNA-binding protein Csl4
MTNGNKTVSKGSHPRQEIPSSTSSSYSVSSPNSTCKDLFEAAKLGDVVQAKILRDKGE